MKTKILLFVLIATVVLFSGCAQQLQGKHKIEFKNVLCDEIAWVDEGFVKSFGSADCVKACGSKENYNSVDCSGKYLTCYCEKDPNPPPRTQNGQLIPTQIAPILEKSSFQEMLPKCWDLNGLSTNGMEPNMQIDFFLQTENNQRLCKVVFGHYNPSNPNVYKFEEIDWVFSCTFKSGEIKPLSCMQEKTDFFMHPPLLKK